MSLGNSRKRPAKQQIRLSRELWLQEALDVLAANGESGMRIEDIAAELGVSKGSFYHHFRDRDEFERAVIEYWDQVYTREVGANVSDGDTAPQDRLWQLMLSITNKDTPRYDIPIFAWALRNLSFRQGVCEEIGQFSWSRYGMISGQRCFNLAM